MMTHPSQVRQPLYENVARYIRKGIFLGRWEHGTHINESKVATELNMSRGPVRDALKVLENEGMIETRSNGRAIVKRFTHTDFTNWSNVRLHLETLAIREALEKGRGTFFSFDAIERTMQEMERVDHLDRHIYLDLQFHEELVALAGNRTLSKLWETLSGTLSTMLELIATHYDNQKQIDMHRAILDALKRGDQEKACLELEHHIQEGNQTIKSVIVFLEE